MSDCARTIPSLVRRWVLPEQARSRGAAVSFQAGLFYNTAASATNIFGAER